MSKMDDYEKNATPPNELSKDEAAATQISVEHRGVFGQFIDSFKPSEAQVFFDNDREMTDAERAAVLTAKSPLERRLKARHLQMIAIGGAIGTGLFIGSGGSLATGGPAALLIAYGIIGIMIYCMTQALGELAIVYPVSGAFSTYSTRFVHESWGFAMGWNYAIQWLVVLPLELVAASLTIQYWNSSISPAAWVAIFWVVIVAINLFGVRGYGEAEFFFSTIKVLAVIGFIILGIVLDCGGGPTKDHIGSRYWHDPGAFANGFKGVCSVFVNAAFAFSGTELVGLAAAETDNPRKSLPHAAKQVFWRITLFYMLNLTMVGLLVAYTDPQLMGSSSVDIKASPFVIAILRAKIKVLPSIINVVILIAVLSVGNSSVYGCSRTLAALAHQGQAPKILGYIDRQGRPLAGVGFTLLIGLLCFLAASPKEGDVFNWLLALSGLSSIFTWGSICLCHLRFRQAMKVQNRSLDEIPWKSQVGIYGSAVGFTINALVLVVQFWTALWPIGGEPDAETFFELYLSAPIVIVCFIGHYLWKRPKYIRASEIDLDSGRRELDMDLLRQEIHEEEAVFKTKPWYFKLYRFFC